MLLPPDLVVATVSCRLNRFAVQVVRDGVPVAAHLANSGRLQELLAPGTPALLAARAGPKRKTAFDLLLVRVGRHWVSTDARLPNALVDEALAEGRLKPLRPYRKARREVRFGHSRMDFLLGTPPEQCLLETKSVTLVEGGIALFPDAPTERGLRHLRELISARQTGLAAAVVFVAQRGDARAFRPHDEADPRFGHALREAAEAGVLVLAYRCRVSPQEIRIAAPIPVRLS